jgi:L-ascorbate metabolism protein UlaG (beta-lactamase superfamily)
MASPLKAWCNAFACPTFEVEDFPFSVGLCTEQLAPPAIFARLRRNSLVTKNCRVVSFLLIALCGCAPPISQMPVGNGVMKIPCCSPEYQNSLQMKYLGVGGFLIQRGDDAILTAPFFSNPSLLRVLLWRIHSDPEQINAFLPPVDHVKAILVGHAHYDHLMDIPYIAQERAPAAKIYGNATMKNILRVVLPEERLIALDDNTTQPLLGQWQDIAGANIRILATKSEHAPHRCLFGRSLCVTAFRGDVSEPLSHLPHTAWGWKGGQPLTYLIDFLGPKGVVDFRIYYQDAASNPPSGFPSPPDVDQKAIDVAILCVPGFNEVQDYPEELLRTLKPRFVILAHWESFFRPRTGDPGELAVVPGGTNPRRFIDRMEVACPAVQWLMPRPGAWLRFSLAHPPPQDRSSLKGGESTPPR